jgi:hypothetical protein
MKQHTPSPPPESSFHSTQQREAILAAVSFAAEQFFRSSSWEQPIAAVLAQLGEAVYSRS